MAENLNLIKARWWFFTHNNPPTDWKKIVDDYRADYALCQLE